MGDRDDASRGGQSSNDKGGAFSVAVPLERDAFGVSFKTRKSENQKREGGVGNALVVNLSILE